MAWSPYFNTLFLDFQPVFFKIREIYPEIDAVFNRFPEIFENEFSMWPLIHLWKAGLLRLDERNEEIAKKVPELLCLGVADPNLLVSIHGIMASMRYFEQCNAYNLDAFFSQIKPFQMRSLSVLMTMLENVNVLRETTFQHVFQLLLQSVDDFDFFRFMLYRSGVDALPAEKRAWYWQVILSLAEKNKKMLSALLDGVNILDDFSGLTEARLSSYLKEIESLLKQDADASQAIKQYLEELKIKIVCLDFLTIDIGLKQKLQQRLKYIHAIGKLGISVDALAEHLSLLPSEEQDNVIGNMDEIFLTILDCLVQVGRLSPENAVALFTPGCMTAIKIIYREIILQNISGEEKLFRSLAEQLQRESEYDRQFVLKAFADKLVDFSWLSLPDHVREYMLKHRKEVLKVCQTGVSIEEFVRMAAFHQKILPVLTSSAQCLLAFIQKKIPKSWYYLVLLNATAIIGDIAEHLECLHALGSQKKTVMNDMLGRLHAVMETAPCVPQTLMSFFSTYFEKLRNFGIDQLDPAVQKKLQCGSGVLFALCSIDHFSFDDFLSFDMDMQNQLLDLPVDVAKLAVYLSSQMTSLEDVMDGYRFSLSLLIDPAVIPHLYDLVSAMRDEDASDIAEERFQEIATCFATNMAHHELTSYEIIEGLKRCYAILLSERPVNPSNVATMGLFRLGNNDGYLADDEASDDELSVSSSVSP